MLESFILSICSGVLLFVIYMYHDANLSESSSNYRYYNEAVKSMNRWLEQTTNLSQSHFQPCRQCGYELALAHDNAYCQRSDLFKLLHPEVVIRDQMVLRDYGGQDLARKIIQQNMYDALPSFVQSRPFEFGFVPTPLETSIIYPYAKNYFRTHTLGKQAGCMLQKYFHVPGQEEIALKSNQSTHFHNYIDKLKAQNKSQQCIKEASYEKPTFRMWLRQECEKFFDTINSEDYKNMLDKEGIQYIFKTNRHLGNGILLLDHQNEKIIRNWYKDSAGCGNNNSQVIIQEYLKNPYLYKGHKMEFRSYFQIASTSPPMLYGYKKALIKQCALKFDLMDFTKEAHVCNTAVTKTHKHTKGQEQDDDLYIDWNLEELQDMLLEQGRIKNRKWLNEELYPQIMRKITHLFFSVEDYMFKDSRVGEFFGVDFILDDDLQLWIFECNRNPNFLAVTEGRKEKFGKLIPDMLEIQMQLIRSRYKRVSEFLHNQLLPSLKAKQFYQQQDKFKAEFLQLMKDRFEPEYKISKDNLAMLAFAGDGTFSGYIRKECLESSRVK